MNVFALRQLQLVFDEKTSRHSSSYNIKQCSRVIIRVKTRCKVVKVVAEAR